MAGQRRCFRRHALHQAAITTNGINVVVEDLEARPVVLTCQPLLRDRHANACGDSLSQWTCRGLDARHPVVLGVTGRLAVELAEPPDVIERHRLLSQRFIAGVHCPCAAEMERRPEQHRSMAVGQYEAITIGPDRILRIEPEDPIPYCIDQRCECHRRARVSGLGLLHCIN